ncbi:DUF4342 domain-containing protein [Inquilinus sp. KBS0705]|nr:DUF4342 domain-containing protein [Inquilinus sp. KBS0705]
MTHKETFNINGKNLMNKVKEIIAEGNVTRITIADSHGKEMLTFPLTYGVVAVVVAPMLAAVGAIAVFVGECSVIVEREVDENSDNTVL